MDGTAGFLVLLVLAGCGGGEVACWDGADDDRDGRFDCADPDCGRTWPCSAPDPDRPDPAPDPDPDPTSEPDPPPPVLEDWPPVEVPVVVDGCDLADVDASAPGAVAFADELYAARVTGAADAHLGISLAFLGDTDGDGLGELAIGAGSEQTFVFAGIPAFAVAADTADTVLTNGVLGNGGVWLATGDPTGDGSPDLVAANADAVLVLPLPVPDGAWTYAELAVAAFTDAYGVGSIGPPATGDLDGDGFDDLVIPGSGTLYVHHGPVEGTIAANDADEIVPSPGAAPPAAVPDLDGDGVDDLVVGLPQRNEAAPTDLLDNGSVEVRAGGRSPVLYGTCDAHVALTEVGAGEEALGPAVAVVGDPTGDGLPDLAVVGWGARDRGAVWVVSDPASARGVTSLTAAADAIVVGAEPGDDLSAAVGLGDLDGDGADDLVVGAQQAWRTGAVHVLLGPLAGTIDAADADLTVVGAASDDAFGSVLSAGDLGGDGVVDLVVGAWASLPNDSGAVYVFDGADLQELLP